MPAVTVTTAMGAKRRGSAGSGLGTRSRLAGTDSEASTVKTKQGSVMARSGGGSAVNGRLEQRRQWLRAAARQAQ